METVAVICGVVLGLWAVTRILGALARLVEGAILILLSIWLITGELPKGPSELSEVVSRLLVALEDLGWKIAVFLSRVTAR